MVEGSGVGCPVVGAEGNQTRMIIQNQAELGGEDFAIDVQFGAGGKIRHPKSLTKGASKALVAPFSKRPRRSEAAS